MYSVIWSVPRSATDFFIFVTKCCSLLSYQVYFHDIFRSVPYNIKLDDSFIHIESLSLSRWCSFPLSDSVEKDSGEKIAEQQRVHCGGSRSFFSFNESL